jgi:uncharacterized membrane-anchored protein
VSSQPHAAVFASFAILLLAPSPARSEGEPPAPEIRWQKGPATVELSNVAEISLGASYAFASAEDARKLLATPSGDEVGAVVPTAADKDWLLLFDYDRVGYVKDDDKDELDPDAILDSYRKGTEQANEERKKAGRPGLHVTGWQEKPHYDPATHNLIWSMIARSDDGREVANYNVRILGREGYLSVVLIDEPQKITAAKPSVEEIIGNLRYRTGKSYAEWVPGDKVAKYGLTALVAAGAGAAAVKLGLLATLGKFFGKAGKFVVVAIAALGAGIAKFWNALRGRHVPRQRPPGAPGAG